MPKSTFPAAAEALPDDPVFAAIERHRQIQANFVSVCENTEDEAIQNTASAAEDDARRELASTIPSTSAGAREKLSYLSNFYEKEYGCLVDDLEYQAIFKSLLASPVLAGGEHV
jgi:hypothetical protein